MLLGEVKTRKFWSLALMGGMFQWAIAFFFVGLVIGDFKAMPLWLKLFNACIGMFNLILGTYNFIRFYKFYEGQIEVLREIVRVDQEQRLVQRGEPGVDPSARPAGGNMESITPEKSKRTFGHYRKLFLG
jgi:hypothetical protein